MNILPDVIVLFYMIFGIFLSLFKKIPQWYIVFLYFIVFKMVFNYDKCTISYWECKLRGVKKHNGYLYQFLDKFIRLRDTNFKYFIILVFTLSISIYYFNNGGNISV